MNPHTPPALPRRPRLIRTFPCATFLIALIALIAVLPAAAQTAQNARHGNRAQAELHIEAQIVPVAYRPPPRPYDRSAEGAVMYSLPAAQPAMTVIEEIHVVAGSDAIAWLRDRPAQAVVLKTLTVLPR
jgi:hypothetical protein